MIRPLEGKDFRRNTLILILIFAGLIALVYAQSLGGTFHFDDAHSIQNNIALLSLSNLISLGLIPEPLLSFRRTASTGP